MKNIPKGRLTFQILWLASPQGVDQRAGNKKPSEDPTIGETGLRSNSPSLLLVLENVCGSKTQWLGQTRFGIVLWNGSGGGDNGLKL